MSEAELTEVPEEPKEKQTEKQETELSAEERAAMVDRLSKAKTEEFTTRQGEIVTQSVRDVQRKYPRNKSSDTERKRYACSTYGAEFGLKGLATNYCVAIQFDAMNKANKEIGEDLRQNLEQDVPESKVFANPLYLKTESNYRALNGQNPVCPRDSLRCEEARSCPSAIKKYGENGFMDTNGNKVSDYVRLNGQVALDKNGNPKLKDGDLLFIRTGVANNTASGWHCVRANVDKKGKATYTGGNGESVNNGLGWCINKQVKVFHTSQYAEKCFKHQFEQLNDKELQQLDNQLREEQLQKQQQNSASAQKTAGKPTAQADLQENHTGMENLTASMSAGHSAISERIAAFRERRNAESLARADIVEGMRKDNERLQQRREELAGMRGEKSTPHYDFAARHFQCEDVAATVKQQNQEARQTEARQQQPQEKQVSGLRRFMNLFSRSEYA